MQWSQHARNLIKYGFNTIWIFISILFFFWRICSLFFSLGEHCILSINRPFQLMMLMNLWRVLQTHLYRYNVSWKYFWFLVNGTIRNVHNFYAGTVYPKIIFDIEGFFQKPPIKKIFSDYWKDKFRYDFKDRLIFNTKNMPF